MHWMVSSHRGVMTMATMGAVVGLAGCTEVMGSGSHQVSLSFTTRSPAAASRATVDLSRDITIGPGGELVLKKIQLVLGRIEVSRSDATTCIEEDDDDRAGDDRMRDDHDEDCEDVSRDPILASIPVDDAVHTVINVPLAAGTYRSLEAKLVPATAAMITALGAPSDMVGNSVRVEGTFKGAPFVFTSPLRAEVELEFDPPLVVDESTKNATVSIDVTRWFTTGNGSVIDPATANPGGPNAALVARNIRESFEAFEDDDRGGDDDHEGEHRGGRDH
jgi:hypothetical protein